MVGQLDGTAQTEVADRMGRFNQESATSGTEPEEEVEQDRHRRRLCGVLDVAVAKQAEPMSLHPSDRNKSLDLECPLEPVAAALGSRQNEVKSIHSRRVSSRDSGRGNLANRSQSGLAKT